MSYCTGTYTIKGKVSRDLWNKHKYDIIKPLKFDTEEEVFLCDSGFFTEEQSLYLSNGDNSLEESENIIELDIWGGYKPDQEYDVGDNAYFEDEGIDNHTMVGLRFCWDDSSYLTEYSTIIDRVEEYLKIDTTSSWVWVSDYTTWRGGRRSLPESNTHIGSIG